jgi:hypothetical protein
MLPGDARLLFIRKEGMPEHTVCQAALWMSEAKSKAYAHSKHAHDAFIQLEDVRGSS